MRTRSINDDMQGRWANALPKYIDSRFLTGKHMDCPICQEGKDRFRWDDKDGRGTYFCSQCGNGDGFQLVMEVTGMSFKELANELSPEDYDIKHIEPTKVSPIINVISKSCIKLVHADEAMMYLRNRGIIDIPNDIRLVEKLEHWHDQKKNYFPAMVARISDKEGNRAGYHVTWLKDGKKAPVDANRKMYKCADTLNGSGVYLSKAADRMVIGEGIETTLAGMILSGVGGIAALDAGKMEAIKLPDIVQNITVLGDNDVSYTGQKAAYTLANRLVREGRTVNVSIPDQPGYDFADVLTESIGE